LFLVQLVAAPLHFISNNHENLCIHYSH